MSSSRRSLLCLVGLLLLGTLAGSAPTFQRPQPGPVTGWVFFSSNTRSGLTFDEAMRRLRSPEQRLGRLLVPGLIQDLGLPRASVSDAIGDWEGGVENSLLVQLPNIRDTATLRYAAAWLGLTCRQQAVLIFHESADGRDRLTTLETRACLAEVRRALDDLGIADRTLVGSDDGTRVIVVDPRGRHQAELERAARLLGGGMESQPGRSEILAGATRDAATRRYRDAMWTWRVTAKR